MLCFAFAFAFAFAYVEEPEIGLSLHLDRTPTHQHLSSLDKPQKHFIFTPMFSLIATPTFSFLTSSDLKSLTVMFCTHPKVVDPCVGDLVFDPVERGVVARAVLLLRQTQVKHFDHYREWCRQHLHEVGEVGHPTELVQMWGGKMFRLKNLGTLRMHFWTWIVKANMDIITMTMITMFLYIWPPVVFWTPSLQCPSLVWCFPGLASKNYYIRFFFLCLCDGGWCVWARWGKALLANM